MQYHDRCGLIGLVLFISIVMTQLSCVAGCNRTFTESKGLTRHKKSCLYVQRLRQASRDARKASGNMHDLLSHLPKPLRRTHRLQVLFSRLLHIHLAESESQVALASTKNVEGSLIHTQPVTNRNTAESPQNEADQIDIDVSQPEVVADMDVDIAPPRSTYENRTPSAQLPTSASLR